MTVKLLTKHYLELLSLKGGCTGLSEFTLVKHTAGNHMSRLIYIKEKGLYIYLKNEYLYLIHILLIFNYIRLVNHL